MFYNQLLCRYSFNKKLQSQTVIREKLRKAPSYKKGMCKMIVKLTTGVNFINVLHAAFTHPDPKSAKKAVKLSVYFAFSGSAHTKNPLIEH